jgi:hypothetical protein
VEQKWNIHIGLVPERPEFGIRFTMRHQLAIPLGSNIKNRTITRPKEKGFKAVARFQSDGNIWPACSARVSTWSSSAMIAVGPQKDPLSVPRPAHDGHGQIGDRVMQGKGFKTDTPIHVGVQGAGHTGKKTGQTKGVHFGKTGMHAHGIGGPVIVPHGTQAAPVTGSERLRTMNPERTTTTRIT